MGVASETIMVLSELSVSRGGCSHTHGKPVDDKENEFLNACYTLRLMKTCKGVTACRQIRRCVLKFCQIDKISTRICVFEKFCKLYKIVCNFVNFILFNIMGYYLSINKYVSLKIMFQFLII